MTGTLHWTTQHCAAADAVATLSGDWTVFVSTPDTFTVHTTGESAMALPPNCFQLLAFDGTTELRWLADGPSGRAVWLAESADALPHKATGSRAYTDRLAAHAVLWGTPTGGQAEAGMSPWLEARVGPARYPCPAGRRHVSGQPHRDRAVLSGVEYVATVDEHGNAGVIEHRLVEITTVDLATTVGAQR